MQDASLNPKPLTGGADGPAHLLRRCATDVVACSHRALQCQYCKNILFDDS